MSNAVLKSYVEMATEATKLHNAMRDILEHTNTLINEGMDFDDIIKIRDIADEATS